MTDYLLRDVTTGYLIGFLVGFILGVLVARGINWRSVLTELGSYFDPDLECEGCRLILGWIDQGVATRGVCPYCGRSHTTASVNATREMFDEAADEDRERGSQGRGL